MNFEFNYDPESEEISITYDNSITLRAYQQSGKIIFVNFDRVDDPDIEDLLKNVCKNTYSLLT
jgi:hypothetical protein